MNITEKHFQQDYAAEQERYGVYLELGLPEADARREAKDYAKPLCFYQHLPDRCFRCGEKLTVPFIFWSGRGADIGLHVECAEHLSMALSRDVIEHRQGGK